MSNPKLLQLSWLEPGDRFEIPSISETMRNLTVISINASSTNVEGEKRNSVNDSWHSFRFPIANTVSVVLIDKGTPKIRNKDNSPKPLTTSKVPRGRGRPFKNHRVLENLIGTEGDFTTRDLIEIHNMKEHEASNIIKAAVKNEKAILVGTIANGRGKPRKVYRLV